MPVESPEDLYGLPLDRFIPEREALAKSLRAEKRRDEAAEVAAKRKPSVTAWAVNQLVRTQAKTIETLFAAGDDLARAQADAAAGKRSGDAMREATRRQREALEELVQMAAGLLSSGGQSLSQTTLERVRDTLLAAAIDEDARRQVQTGCLTHELQFAGLGILGQSAPGANPPPVPAERSTKPARPAANSDAGAKASKAEERKQQKEAERQRKEAEVQRRSALTAARHSEADVTRAVTRAEKGLAAAQAKREEAAAALQEAERLLREAEQQAQEKAAELSEAERAVRELRKS